MAAALEHLAEVDALVVIGGEGTLRAALELHADEQVPLVGVPKTIDNDISATEVTFGFHTAVQIATDAIDRLHTTAEAHDRVMVCEVMGRNAGWIAIYAGIAGGAAEIIIPEEPFDIDSICAALVRRHRSGGVPRSSSSPKGRSQSPGRWRSPSARSTSTVTSASAGSRTFSPRRSSTAPGSSRG